MTKTESIQHCTSTNSSAGFTLIEIVVILVTIGIIAAVAVVRLPDPSDMGGRTEVDTLRTHLQYAQQIALTRHMTWGIDFKDATTYWLYFENTNGNHIKVTLPGAAAMNAANDPDNDLSTINNRYLLIDTSNFPSSIGSAAAKIEFDANGSPSENPTPCNPPGSRCDIQVRSTDGTLWFTIVAYTGVIL